MRCTGGIRVSFAVAAITLNKNSLAQPLRCPSVAPRPSGRLAAPLEVAFRLSLFLCLFCCCHQLGESLGLFLTSPGDRLISVVPKLCLWVWSEPLRGCDMRSCGLRLGMFLVAGEFLD